MKLSKGIIENLQRQIDVISREISHDHMEDALYVFDLVLDDARAELAEDSFRLDHHQQNTSRPIE
jgi:hypothetical protein